MKGSKKIGIVFLVLYLILLVGASIYSVGKFQNQLTRVTLVMPKAGTINYQMRRSFPIKAYEKGTSVTIEIPKSLHIPKEAIEAGTPFLLYENKKVWDSQVITTAETEDNEAWQVTISLSDKMELDALLQSKDKAYLEVSFDCSNLSEYEWILPRRALHYSQNGQPAIYVVKPQKGAWGTEYILKEQMMICFPEDLEAEEVAIFLYPDGPVADWSSGFLYEGLQVRLLRDEPEN